MDHLPSVTNPAFPPHQIPYLRTDNSPVLEYDNQGFSDFPFRAGFDKTSLFEGRLRTDLAQQDQSVAQFVQQWLYFGLLSAGMSHTFAMTDLLQDFTQMSPETGGRVITTRHLDRYLVQWRDRLNPDQVKRNSDTVQRLDTILDETQRHVARYMCRGGEETAKHPMRKHTDISLSIMALGVVFTRAKLRIWPGSRPFAWQRSELVLSRMTDAGWCPSDISMLEKLMTPSGMYYASLLRPRMAQHNHLQAGCNADTCNVMNISAAEKAEYKTVHTQECSGSCIWKDVPEEQLTNILAKSDGLPVVRVEVKPDGDIDLIMTALKLEKDSDYVAISHVWAERLGNTHENAMPSCQLRRIQALVTAASDGQSRSFWIDTLCVPQDNFKDHLKSLRLRAIQNMDAVYHGSSAVLVLDSELISSTSTAPFEEQLARFACCSWIRRLWTLQEAVTGPKVLLQFSNRPVDMMRDLYLRLQHRAGFFTLSQTVLTEMTDFLQRIVLVKDPGSYPRITALWNACQYRSTSEKQDEAVILAVLLGLDTRPILAAAKEDMWWTFLLQQRIFPKDLLFSSGPRVKRDGFRWAPPNFIRRPTTTTATLLLSMGTAEATSNGLNVTAQGYVFKPPRTAFRAEHPSFWMLDEATQKWYMIAQRTINDDGQPEWPELRHALQKCDRLGIIVNQDLNRNTFALGVLVDISKGTAGTVGDCLSARFLATVNLMLEQQNRWATLEQWRQQEAADVATESCRVVLGTPVPPDQLWCVG
ncbi:hypothetical protein LTR99_010321 [Exophiala xenobiotica]|uniref:Heterokaryon incompatibility domain-containing protein n=1 Tax=Vermiconidia calcicola TaxID=1690605 RepID=A0AAV9Q1X3_9PEZI|nr:hypothetical protein LTR99_010321 [Exophiala xenobiotica]KAK5534040.1 hypothetical protein LTR25_007020 [Vermiconidia calcicola]